MKRMVLAGLLIMGCGAARAQTAAAGPTLSEARMGHYSTILADGTVLVVGGRGRGFSSSSTVDHIRVGEGSVVQRSLQGEHDSAAVTKLPDGTLFIGGGSAALGIPRHDLIEIYDPATGTVLRTGRFQKFRAAGTAAVLTDGRVLVVGGWWTHNDAHTYPETIEPGTVVSSLTGPLSVPRSWPWVVRLSGGRALVLGGLGPTGAGIGTRPERYDPGTGTFEEVTIPFLVAHPTLTLERTMHQKDVEDVRLPDGRVLLMGFEGTKPWLVAVDAEGAMTEFAPPSVFPDPTVAGTWQYAVDRGRGVVHVLSAAYPATGNATARFTVTTLGMDGSVQASGTTGDVETGYFFHYSGLALLPDGALFLTGGYERDNFTAVDRSLVLQPSSRAPSLSVTLVPAIWIDSPKGTTCTLQFSMHVEGPWIDLAEVLVTNVPQPYVDLAAGSARRFYQVLVKP